VDEVATHHVVGLQLRGLLDLGQGGRGGALRLIFQAREEILRAGGWEGRWELGWVGGREESGRVTWLLDLRQGDRGGAVRVGGEAREETLKEEGVREGGREGVRVGGREGGKWKGEMAARSGSG
jgi:hypothetical protein